MMETNISRLIELAKAIKVTEEHRREQRRSFVFGNTAFENPDITRELVDQIDEEIEKLEQRGDGQAEVARRETENGRRQYEAALDMIRSYLEPGRPFALRASHVQSLQSIAVDGIERQPGQFRTTAVGIEGAKHQPPEAFRVQGLVTEMCEYVNDNLHEKSPFHLSAYLMWRHNWIHPFADGNGRTSRMLSYVVLSLMLGYQLPGRPTIPEQIQQDRSAYFGALEAADASELTGSMDLTVMET
jgi:Fic family protein